MSEDAQKKPEQDRPQRKWSKLHFVLLAAAGFFVGMATSWDPQHPAKFVVDEVAEKITHYYRTHDTVPATLDFVEDDSLRSDIQKYSIIWLPDELYVLSAGNKTYEPDTLYQLTFGHFGNRISKEHDSPGKALTTIIPSGTKITPTINLME